MKHTPPAYSTPKRSGNRRHGKRRHNAPRRGAALIELAISLLLFLTIVLGMIDLGIMVLRHQQLTEAARFVGRAAAVRGNLSDRLEQWGPGAMVGNATDGSPIGNMLSNRMLVPNPNELQYVLNWVDGGNDTRNNDRVQVTTTLPYRPFFTLIFPNSALSLRTETTVPIAH